MNTPVLVVMKKGGVYFGYADALPTDSDKAPDELTLTGCRFCSYWPDDMKGILGLASDGPNDKCRVGPPETRRLRGIASVSLVEEPAVARWEAAP